MKIELENVLPMDKVVEFLNINISYLIKVSNLSNNCILDNGKEE